MFVFFAVMEMNIISPKKKKSHNICGLSQYQGGMVMQLEWNGKEFSLVRKCHSSMYQ